MPASPSRPVVFLAIWILKWLQEANGEVRPPWYAPILKLPGSKTPTVVIPMDNNPPTLYTIDPNVTLDGVIESTRLVLQKSRWGYKGAVRIKSSEDKAPIKYDGFYNLSAASCLSDIDTCADGFGLMFWLQIGRGNNDRPFYRHFIKFGPPGLDIYTNNDSRLWVSARTKEYEFGPAMVEDFTLQREVWYHITVQINTGNFYDRLIVRLNGVVATTVDAVRNSTMPETVKEITIGSSRTSGVNEKGIFKIDELVFVESYNFVSDTSVWAYALSAQRYGASCNTDKDCLGGDMQCKDDVCQCLGDHAHSLKTGLDAQGQNLQCTRVQQEGKECTDDSDCSFRMICDASSCVCEAGFTYSALSASCEDVDECRNVSVCGNQTAECTNTYGSFDCSCQESGFVWNATTEQCDDIDECSFGNGGCSDQCFNTNGSFTCGCKEGFGLSHEQKICFDVDECLNLTICGDPVEAVCSNTVGSYECSCKLDGYFWNITTQQCEDIDECSFENGGCSDQCFNTNGSFLCGCKEGFGLSLEQKICFDVDECLNLTICGDPGKVVCSNTAGSYECGCKLDGYFWNITTQKCEDIDECSFGNGGCSDECFNTEGSFTCGCKEGFGLSLEQKICFDVDECLNLTICGDLDEVVCSNTVGSYECSCKLNGYLWNNLTEQCEDIDECEIKQGGCSHFCVNTDGSFACSCPTGMSLSNDTVTCLDLDECLNLTICGDQEEVVCSNTAGSYECGCKLDGYFWNITTQQCEDIDECEIKQGGCSHFCVNSNGSFACSCPSGMSLSNDTVTCLDDDECLDDNGGCSDLCINTYGSYRCTCIALSTLGPDGLTCQSSDPCADTSVCPSWATCRVAEGGGYVCTCPEGKAWNRTTSECENVDECAKDNGGCTHICVDTDGSFLCQCDEGFTLNHDKKSCKDVNECKVKNGGCDQMCINTQGSYDCACSSGYVLQQDLYSCTAGMGMTSFKIRITFTNTYQLWMSDPNDVKTKRLTLALKNKADILGHKALSSVVNFKGLQVFSLSAGSVYANAHLLFDEDLDGLKLSYVVWLFREALQDLAVETNDVVLEAANDNSTVQAVVGSEHEGNSTVDVVVSCSLVDYNGLCPENSQCVDVEGNIPTCVCLDGYSGENCTDTSPEGDGDNEDEDSGMSSGTLLLIILVFAFSITILVICIFCMICFHRRRSASPDIQHRSHRYSLPRASVFPGYSLYGNEMMRRTMPHRT